MSIWFYVNSSWEQGPSVKRNKLFWRRRSDERKTKQWINNKASAKACPLTGRSQRFSASTQSTCTTTHLPSSRPKFRPHSLCEHRTADTSMAHHLCSSCLPPKSFNLQCLKWSFCLWYQKVSEWDNGIHSRLLDLSLYTVTENGCHHLYFGPHGSVHQILQGNKWTFTLWIFYKDIQNNIPQKTFYWWLRAK